MPLRNYQKGQTDEGAIRKCPMMRPQPARTQHSVWCLATHQKGHPIKRGALPGKGRLCQRVPGAAQGQQALQALTGRPQSTNAPRENPCNPQISKVDILCLLGGYVPACSSLRVVASLPGANSACPYILPGAPVPARPGGRRQPAGGGAVQQPPTGSRGARFVHHRIFKLLAAWRAPPTCPGSVR